MSPVDVAAIILYYNSAIFPLPISGGWLDWSERPETKQIFMLSRLGDGGWLAHLTRTFISKFSKFLTFVLAVKFLPQQSRAATEVVGGGGDRLPSILHSTSTQRPTTPVFVNVKNTRLVQWFSPAS